MFLLLIFGYFLQALEFLARLLDGGFKSVERGEGLKLHGAVLHRHGQMVRKGWTLKIEQILVRVLLQSRSRAFPSPRTQRENSVVSRVYRAGSCT